MIEKITIDLVEQMEGAKLIDEDMAEHYVYVLLSWIEKFITVGTIILISVVTQTLIPTMFFLIFFLALRKRTGGYHLNKFYQCYWATVASYLVILVVSVFLVSHPTILYVLLLLSIGIIGIIGTINHPNMHMNQKELVELKKAARILVLIEGTVIYGFIMLEADMVIVSYMAIAIIMCATLLCIAKLMKQEVRIDEEG